MIRVRGVPIYWGIETEPDDRRFWTYSVLHEVLPPFRHSTYGLRIRVSPWHWLHVGKFLYDRNANLYGLTVNPRQIREWGKRAEAQIQGGDPGAVEVRSVQPSGPDRLAGVHDDEERRAVQGAESL